jgi:hypothetical protein
MLRVAPSLDNVILRLEGDIHLKKKRRQCRYKNIKFSAHHEITFMMYKCTLKIERLESQII